jgi:hypothetical protein
MPLTAASNDPAFHNIFKRMKLGESKELIEVGYGKNIFHFGTAMRNADLRGIAAGIIAQ